MAEEVNEHLRNLNLEELSDSEFRSLDQFSMPALLLEAPAKESGDEHAEEKADDHSQRQGELRAPQNASKESPKVQHEVQDAIT